MSVDGKQKGLLDGAAIDVVGKMLERRCGETDDLGSVVPAPETHRGGAMWRSFEVRTFGVAEQTAL